MTDSTITVSFEVLMLGLPVKIKARLEVSGPDPVVLETWFASNGAPIVCLPDPVKAAILRHAVVEAKDLEREPMTEFAWGDFDARR